MIQKKFQYLALKLAGLGIVFAAAAPFASAIPVTYSTTGVLAVTYTQTNVPGAPNFTDYVQYTGSGNVSLNAPGPPGHNVGSLGSLFVASSEGSTFTVSGTFTLNINQTAPPGVGSLGAEFSGTITRPLNEPPTSDTLELTFSNTSVNIAGIEYTLTGLTGPGDNVLDLNEYNNPLTADISQLPEPTFLTLTGFGFAGLCFVAYRRRRTA